MEEEDFNQRINELREDSNNEGAREGLLARATLKSLSKQQWISWLAVEGAIQNNEEMFVGVLDAALADYPHSPELWRVYIEHSANKLPALKEAAKAAGFIDTGLWTELREADPAHVIEYFKQELRYPVPYYSDLKTELESFCKSQSAPIPDVPTPPEIETLKETGEDFSTEANSIRIVQACRSSTIAERALDQHPYSEALWLLLVRIDPKNLSNSGRAVRFCPSSGAIWSFVIRTREEPNYAGLSYAKDDKSASIILGALISKFPDRESEIVKQAMEAASFRSEEGQQLLFEQQDYLLEKTGRHQDRIAFLRKAIEQSPQRTNLWIRLANATQTLHGDNAARSILKEGISRVTVNKSDLLNAWVRFESTAGENQFDSLLGFITDEICREITEKPPEKEEPFERRTVFVGGFNELTKKRELFELFGSVGTVEHIRMKKGFAFVQYQDFEQAQKAITNLDGSILNGTRIEVKPHQRVETFTVYLRFPNSTHPTDINDFIRSKSHVQHFRTRIANAPSDSKDGPSRGYGFVDVFTKEDMAELLRLNNQPFLNGKLHVERAKTDRRTAKKSNTASDDEAKDFFNLH